MGKVPRYVTALAIASAGLLGSASAASAAQRYASATSTVTTGSCSASAPCTIGHAVNDAAAGDEIIVAPGGYGVQGSLSVTVPVAVHGVAGQPRPQLIGSSSRAGPVLELAAGGSASHLILDGQTSMESTLAIEGATAEDLLVRSAAGTGAELSGRTGGTILRDSVVRVTGAGPAMEIRDGHPLKPGPIKVLNVTAVATGNGAVGAEARQRLATTTFRNAIVRGSAGDVQAFINARVAVDHSNLRPNASGYTDGGGNQSVDPVFVDWVGGDLHEGSQSPTIDAGIPDPDLGRADADGASRVLAAAPDMGAYEFGNPYVDDTAPVQPATPPAGSTSAGGSGTGTDSGTQPLPPAAEPVLGSTVTVGTSSGTVRVRTPGGTFVPLSGDASIPVNSTIDASHGVVNLTSARNATGTTQTAKFWAGRFRINQSRSGDRRTVLTLVGGNSNACRPAVGSSKVIHASRNHRIRRLWGSDSHGRYRTRGRRGQATVRGTRWLTEDRCEGTLFKVTKGAIDVAPEGNGKTVRLHAGERYLAPAARNHR